MSEQVPKAKLSPLPDIGDIVFLLVVQLLIFTIPRYLFADGSTGWHLVAGQFILKTFSIPHQDLISYTFPQAGWVAYEWLSDLIMALCVQVGGIATLGVAVALSLGLLFLLLYEDCRRVGCHFILALTVTVIGALAASVHWLARPHIFTFFGVYIFSRFLEEYRRGTISGIKLATILSVTMMLWVNLHPGFILGFVLIGIYFVSDLLVALFNSSSTLVIPSGAKRGEEPVQKISDGSISRAKTYGLTLLFSVLATFSNPYGVGLHAYILKYLHASTVIASTEEFLSPAFHGQLQQTCLELLFVMVFVGLVFAKRTPSLPQFLCVLAFGHLALSAIRGAPMFVVVAVPFIANLFGTQQQDRLATVGARFPRPDRSLVSDEGGETPPLQAVQLLVADEMPGVEDMPMPATNSVSQGEKFVRWYRAVGKSFDKTESDCKMHLIPIITAVVLLAMTAIPGIANATFLKEIGFDTAHLPSKTLDYIREHKLDPLHGFNHDNWGGYIRYQLGTPVFIDDRADFYPQTFFLEYAKVNSVLPGWTNVLDSHKINWVLCPKTGRLAAQLKVTARWKMACEDGAADLFVRQ